MRVLVLDTQELFLRGVESLVTDWPQFELRTQLCSCDSPPTIPDEPFDVLIIGLCCDGIDDGVELAARLAPSCKHRIAVLAEECASRMDAVLAANFDALLHRSSPGDSLRRAVEHTMQGKRFVDERVGHWLLACHGNPWAVYGLTRRELDIVELCTRGLSIREISRRLFISPNTVKFHLANVYRKTGVRTKHQLRELASRPGPPCD